jgi:hypothetical protein
MNSKTVAILDDLKHFPWFKHVGEHVNDDVVKAEDWKQAEALCKTTVWESVELQVGNCLSYRVNRTNYDRFLQWNPTTLEINERIDEAIRSGLKEVTDRLQLGRRFAECVESDITLSCLEAEFSDLWPPIFFLNHVLPWYRRGHFPCGWQGPELPPGWTDPMPPGKLIVF